MAANGQKVGHLRAAEKVPHGVPRRQEEPGGGGPGAVKHPKLLLADEPTGALDSRATDELLELFSQINRSGQTILMVTHSVKAASHAGRVLFIKDGQVFHQLYRGDQTNDQLYQTISDTLTMLHARGGEGR